MGKCKGLVKGEWNLIITGLVLLTFMTIHLFQFRFGDTSVYGGYMIRPPPYLINFWGILRLNLFWTDDESVPEVPVRDIYQLEYSLFKYGDNVCADGTNGDENFLWSWFYIFCVVIFFLHACLGWKKLTDSDHFGIPKGHRCKVKCYGVILLIVDLIRHGFVESVVWL